MNHKEKICNDLRIQLQHILNNRSMQDKDIHDYRLYLLDNILQENRQSLLNFPPMPLPHYNWTNIEVSKNCIMEQYFNPCIKTKELNYQLPCLNKEQRLASNTVYHSVHAAKNQTTNIFFIDGPRGSGKTFLYQTICNMLWSKGMSWIYLSNVPPN
jgi:ATP-dependent protease Clp ATPase subunit